jgi:hypothetical protein
MSEEAVLTYLNLARIEITNTKGKRLPLVEKYLALGRSMLNLSKTKMKRLLLKLGVCLLDFKVHHDDLRKFLRKNPSSRIKRDKAKAFEHVKMCLVRVY